jgi:hypothetical protein
MSEKTIRGKIKDVDAAYAAGGIDADGSISICRVFYTKEVREKNRYRSPRFVLEVTYTNTYEDIVNWYCQTFGGTWAGKTVKDRRGHETRMQDGRIITGKQLTYQWKITSKKALEFLKITLPYYVGKKRQTELAIEFQSNILQRTWVKTKTENGNGVMLSPEEIEKRNWYHQMVMGLNKHLISPAETKRGNTLAEKVKR